MRASLLLLALLGAASAETGSPLILEAQENVNLDNDPTAPAATFSFRRLRKDVPEIQTWQVQVFDRQERKVAFMQGVGPPPKGAVKWYATTPDGQLLPNGFYDARLVWKDAGGGFNKSPFVSVSLLSMDELRGFLGPSVSLNFKDEGLVIRIKDLLVFAPGQVEIKPDAGDTLRKIARFLKAHPRNRLVVHGYTDSTGSAAANTRLSQLRARAMHDYLVAQGVEPARLSWKGLGAGDPIASNDTEEGRARNRRVEINVLRPD